MVPPSWTRITVGDRCIVIDPAYLKTHFAAYPKRIEFSSWPDPIDGLPEPMAVVDIRAKTVIPIHRLKTDPRQLVEMLRHHAGITVLPLDIGESCTGTTAVHDLGVGS